MAQAGERDREAMFEAPFESDRESLESAADDAAEDGATGTVPDGDELDWAALWDEFNIDADSRLSGTQLAAAIRASEETGAAVESDAGRLVEAALAAGHLSQVKQKAHSSDGSNTLITAGYRLEVDR